METEVGIKHFSLHYLIGGKYRTVKGGDSPKICVLVSCCMFLLINLDLIPVTYSTLLHLYFACQFPTVCLNFGSLAKSTKVLYICANHIRQMASEAQRMEMTRNY